MVLPILWFIFLLIIAADLFISVAVIYHVRTYTLADWKLPYFIVPGYIIANAIIILLALTSLIQIQL